MRRESGKKYKEAGHCQACMRVQMVRQNRSGILVMVHHGYKRPGTGWIEGGCIGVDWPPFELDRTLVIQIRDGQIKAIADYTKALDDLTSGRRRTFRVEDPDQPVYSDQLDRSGRKKVLRYKRKEISLDSEYGPEQYDAKRERDRLIRVISRELEAIIREAEERTKMIDEWKVRPILEWEAYEEERKRRGAPEGVPAEVGALLLKMESKGKGTVPFPVLRQALKLLGWSADPIVHVIKPRSMYEIHDAMTKFFGPGVTRITETEHSVQIMFDTMEQAQESHARLRAGKPPPPREREAGEFYFERLGPVMADARAYQHHAPGPGFAISKVSQALPGASFESPRKELPMRRNEFAFTTDRYKGAIRHDIAPQGFWTWAYRQGLGKDAEAYVKEHARRPEIEGVDDEEGRMVAPRPLEAL